MTRIAQPLAAALALAVVLSMVACSNSEAGIPTAADTDVTTTTEPDTETPSRTMTSRPSTSKGGSSPLDDIESCELLSTAEVSQLGLAAGEPANVGTSRGCDWTKSGDWGVAIGLNADLGFKEANLQGSTPVPVGIGKHEAHKVENLGGGNGTCDVFVVTSESSFVQVVVGENTARDTPKACRIAVQIAQLIDPKLP